MTLDEIKKLCDAATPGPWTIDHPGHAEGLEPAHISLRDEQGRRQHEVIVDHRRDYSDPFPDAAFIAAAREMLPKLIKVAEAAKVYRDKVDYTGGDGTQYFFEEQTKLDDAYAALETK